MANLLPSIPAKRYFTIGEVSELCRVKPYVLRYWEQEFTQLKPMKRRGNRRYYQHHEVLLIRRIRDLLYDQGFTISGARNRLMDGPSAADAPRALQAVDAAMQQANGESAPDTFNGADAELAALSREASRLEVAPLGALSDRALRAELMSIRDLLQT
jgi:DNA-binding transcriptional MerR regulator